MQEYPLFDFDKKYVFCKKLFFGDKVVPVAIEIGKVKKVESWGLVLDNGVVLTHSGYDFAVEHEEEMKS